MAAAPPEKLVVAKIARKLDDVLANEGNGEPLAVLASLHVFAVGVDTFGNFSGDILAFFGDRAVGVAGLLESCESAFSAGS